MAGQAENAGRHLATLCGAEVYPPCDPDAGWACIRQGRCTPGNTHRDLDGTEWPVGQRDPLFAD